MDTDFAHVTKLLLRPQDKSGADISLSAAQCRDCLETCEALFWDLGVFMDGARWTYTQTLLKSLSRTRKARVGKGFVAIGWPSGSQPDLSAAKAHARDLYLLVKDFFLEFSRRDHRGKFQAFNVSSDRLPACTRAEYIRDLAKHEGLNPAASSHAFMQALPHALKLAPVLGDNKAVWTEIAEGMRVGKKNGKTVTICVSSY